MFDSRSFSFVRIYEALARIVTINQLNDYAKVTQTSSLCTLTRPASAEIISYIQCGQEKIAKCQ